MVSEWSFSKHNCMAAPYGRNAMSSTKRMTVTEAVRADLSGMKEPGMTVSEPIETHDRAGKTLRARRFVETTGKE